MTFNVIAVEILDPGSFALLLHLGQVLVQSGDISGGAGLAGLLTISMSKAPRMMMDSHIRRI